MKIALRFLGEEREMKVPVGTTIAQAAEAEGVRLFGSCQGQNQCCQCSFRVRKGLEKLLKKDGTPYVHPPGAAAYVKTCQVTPAENGVSIDSDDRARRY